jgi:glyoxylase-like metal-dependent hydrolase (beta-lactamase superfamily II)
MLRTAVALIMAACAAPLAIAADYTIDMDEIRRLANEMPGDKPSGIRVESVGDLPFTWDLVVEGAAKEPVAMALLSYQIVFPDRIGLIDVTMDKAMADAWGGVDWDAAASDRLDAAMAQADFILITHEHADHIGRLVTKAADKAQLARAKLLPEQTLNSAQLDPLKWPEGAFEGYAPLAYERAVAIAPGVVAIRAAGHTPGSQLVFVETSGGQDYLFLGDAVWRARNIAEGKGRGPEAVKMLNEDAAAVQAQIAEFQRLAKDEPALVMLPGHDGELVDMLVGEGRLVANFQ